MDHPISAETLKEWDKAHVWHPFTDMKQYLADDPVIIRRGQGVRLQDVEGRWYYDGVSSVWLNVHGHHVPALDNAIRRQLDHLAHSTLLGQGNVPSVLLAKELVEIAPAGLTRVFYSDSGATAVEIALKIAIQYWKNKGVTQKSRILGFTNNYHGDTIGAMGVAPDPLFHWPFLDLLPDNPRVPYPYCYRCPLDLSYPNCHVACIDSVETTLRDKAHELAAVIVEPVEGAGGIIPSPPGYLQKLRELTTRYNVLLIVDEVATGFGRTGDWFHCLSEEVTPDLLTMAKGITGGYLPLAATLATEQIFQAFLGPIEQKKTLFHGHSYTGNPLGAAVALENLKLLRTLIPTLPEKARRLSKYLAPLQQYSVVGDIRQKGLMVGIELVRNRATRDPFAWETQAGWAVAKEAQKRGLLIRPLGPVVVFMPPLASTDRELEDMVRILAESLQRFQESLV